MPVVRCVRRGWGKRAEVGGAGGRGRTAEGTQLPGVLLPLFPVLTCPPLLGFAKASGWGLPIGCYYLPNLLIIHTGNFCHQLYTMIESS